MNHLERLRGDGWKRDSSGLIGQSQGEYGNYPSLLFIEEGEYELEQLGRNMGGDGNSVLVKIPLLIYGAGREKTTLVGVGLKIQGNKSNGKSNGIVEIGDLKIWGNKGFGLYAYQGMNVRMSGISVEECQGNGVEAYGADISCDDLQVVGCGESGVRASHNATITLSGQGTSVQGNNVVGRNWSIHHDTYGLEAHNQSILISSIHLVHPLTKEQISTNNGVETGVEK